MSSPLIFGAKYAILIDKEKGERHAGDSGAVQELRRAAGAFTCQLCPAPGAVPGTGSGKSTLLRLVAQIEKPDNGDVLYQGKRVLGDRKFLRCTLGYVPQNAELVQELTVKRQLLLWRSACGVPGPLPGDILELLGLEPLLKTPIGALSGGMAQRVSIALALLSRPRVLLMDEATSGLDGGYAPRLLDWLERFVAEGGSLMWCSHHPEELKQLCGAVLHLENGILEG